MSRAANYTIKGFIYQFNKTLQELINAQADASIIIEGIIEDIEVHTKSSTKAIQCKYHESVDIFTGSKLYDPILQMLLHFSKNPSQDIDYKIYAHFPNPPTLTPQECATLIDNALISENKDLASFIKGIASNRPNKDDFLKKFSIVFSESLDKLSDSVIKDLKNHFDSGDVETFIYPNAINLIAKLSTNRKISDRSIKKSDFLQQLHQIRKITINKWTLALKTKDEILKSKKAQLKINFNKNARNRLILIDADAIDEFNDLIVIFIKAFIEKYNCKPTHVEPPIFAIVAEDSIVSDIESRLYHKGLKINNGFVGLNTVNPEHFFRPPLTKRTSGSSIDREFHVRLLYAKTRLSTINHKKCDDLFIIGDDNLLSDIDTTDINIESIAAQTFQELNFLFGLNESYE